MKPISWNNHELTLFVVNSLWIHYVFPDSLWIHYFFANSLKALYLCHELSISDQFSDLTMNLLSILRYDYEFTFACECTIDFFSVPKTTLNSLSISGFHYELTVFLTKLLWIHYPFRKFIMNLLSLTFLDYEFTIFLLIHFDCTIIFLIWLWKYYHEITMNSLSFPQNSLWIHYVCPEFTMNSSLFQEFTLSSLSISRFNSLSISYSLSIVYLFRDLTMNWLSVSRIYCELTILF